MVSGDVVYSGLRQWGYDGSSYLCEVVFGSGQCVELRFEVFPKRIVGRRKVGV